ncbi:MAG: RNA polymerase sigma factor [Deltaproteobacteria bacterium]|nr:RNA polymerase sigma factor [Deltaproteobacteria bacterium]
MNSTLDAEQLFRDHAAFAAAFLHRLGVPERDVPDLVQEVFLVIHRKGGFRPGAAKPRSYVGAIAFRIASAHRRRKRPLLAPETFEAGVTHETPLVRAEVRESLERVQRCLETLDWDHRAVFVLFEVEGFKAKEVAEALDIPEGTVHSRLHNARRRFRARHAQELSHG